VCAFSEREQSTTTHPTLFLASFQSIQLRKTQPTFNLKKSRGESLLGRTQAIDLFDTSTYTIFFRLAC